MGFSIIIPLGTDQDYEQDVRKRLREWREEDAGARRAWLESMVTACAKIGASEIIWGAPWGVPEGSQVPAGQLFTLRAEDPARFSDIREASALARSLGIERVTEFSGIGRKASLLRRMLTLWMGAEWIYPRTTNYRDRALFDEHIRAALEANCTGSAVDSMAPCDDLYHEAWAWATVARWAGLELLGEGYMPTAGGIGWMLWAWQILRTGLAPRANTKGLRFLCVVSGHTEGVVDPASAVRLGREMQGRGWWVVYSCHSVEWVRGVGEALVWGR